MNHNFFNIPEEKQRIIMNGGFQIFAQNTYKKAPVAEIAAMAGISKSLLFYHFKNKKEFYLFLWDKSVELTSEAMKEYNVLGTDDFFEMLRRSLNAKCDLLRNYPYVSEFSLRAYYEESPDIKEEIHERFKGLNLDGELKIFQSMDTSKLRKDIDLHLMYQEMTWASDGYLHHAFMTGNIDPNQLNKDFDQLINMWETIYRN